MTPVSTSMAEAISLTFTPWLGEVGEPGARTSFSSKPLPAPMACPVHFNEPAGQQASGQLCIGTSPSLDERSTKLCAAFTAPRGQGTPQVTPLDSVGAPPSSQCNSTSPIVAVEESVCPMLRTAPGR